MLIATSYTFVLGFNRIGGFMVSLLTSSLVDRGLNYWVAVRSNQEL